MFKSKLAISLISLSACLMLPLIARGGSIATTVDLSAEVDAFTEWDVAAQTAIGVGDWTGGHIASAGAAATKTVSRTYTIYSNRTVTITPTGTANGGILTLTGQTLKTEYQLSGESANAAALDVSGAGQGDFLEAVAGNATGFFKATNTYLLTHTADDGGAYDIKFDARASSPGAAVDVGTYTCQVTLTASW